MSQPLFQTPQQDIASSGPLPVDPEIDPEDMRAALTELRNNTRLAQKLLAEMKDKKVPPTEVNFAHLWVREKIVRLLSDHGVNAYRCTAATLDRQGVVRLSFGQFFTLVDSLRSAESS